MKIGVVSDSHDRAPMLVAAVGEAKRAGAEAIIHCGDVIGANALRPLLELGLPTHIVHGNNLGDALALCNLCAASSGADLLWPGR
jgi:predicted phosphodiesterase